MRKLRTIAALTAALWLGYAPLAAQSSRTLQSTDVTRVSATLTALFAASERQDMAALDSLYAGDSLTIFEGTGVNRGWADYRDHHLAPELQEMKNLQYRPSDLEVHVDGRTAWVLFRYTLKADVNGRHVDSIGLGTAILEQRGARWVVRHMQTAGRSRRPTDP